MKLNELKIGDKVKIKIPTGVAVGYVFSLRRGESIVSQQRTPEEGSRCWTIPESDIISKFQPVEQEIAIEHPSKPFSFEFRPQRIERTSSRTHFDTFFSEGVGEIKNEKEKFSRWEQDIRLPWHDCLGVMTPASRYRVTIEEIP